MRESTLKTFTNAEQAGLWFATRTLSYWARKVEAQFSLSVLAEPYELELDLSGFLRGDPKTRWDTYNIARERNILTVDEFRQAEGYGPKPKGQQHEPQPVAQ